MNAAARVPSPSSTRMPPTSWMTAAYLVKAFNLAIKGLHYHLVMNGITRELRR